MNNLTRELAPISAAAWEMIDAEARRVLRLTLAGRKLVDFKGPLGAEAAAVNLGREARLKNGPVAQVEALRREALPLIALRTSFDLSRAELDAVERGAEDPDLDPLIDAATRMAHAEDTAIFHSYEAGGIQGIEHASAHPALPISENYQEYPRSIAEATRLLRESGIDGPYAIALGPRCYAGLTKTMSPAGLPLLEYVRRLLDGPIVSAPGVNGAMVLSQRGGDFELVVGQDFSIGYLDHTATAVHLYIQESLTSRVLAPEAAVPLTYGDAKAGRGKSRGS